MCMSKLDYYPGCGHECRVPSIRADRPWDGFLVKTQYSPCLGWPVQRTIQVGRFTEWRYSYPVCETDVKARLLELGWEHDS